jgi:aspartyl-tRNA(Asn)/glutamyl-tRNA(Gln) amidotransferase subunit A
MKKMTAAQMGRAIERGELDPVDLAESYFAAIEAHEFSERIYARLTKDRAYGEARAARDRAKAGLRRSALDGVPISWKDLFDTAGCETAAGSALLQGRVPDTDALVLKYATLAGAVCLGKTHMSELAFSGLGLNPITQTPPCVNDHDAVSGGSSSGAAASVAFGLAPLAIGSDTGGSVRIPSVWNDLVGLKTTSGDLSLDGVVPLCARFDTVGPLAQTVEDAALAYAILSGRPVIDMSVPTSLKGRKFAVLTTTALDHLRDAPRAAFETAVAKFAESGAEIICISAPEVETALALSATLFAPEAYGTWQSEIEAAPHKMFDKIRDRFRGGASVGAAEYIAGWQTLERLRTEFVIRTAGYDAVLVPTAPSLPPNIARLLSDDDYYVSENLLALRNTRIANLMGTCALTLPTGVPSCGITLMGQPFQERRILRLGLMAEAALA